MVDNDWMDEVIAGDGHIGSSDRFEPTTIRTIVAGIREDSSLVASEVNRRVNEALAEEAMNLRYAQTMSNVEVEALRDHVFSPNVTRPDPDSRHQTSAEELTAKADEIESKARIEFEDGRRLLVDTMRELHGEGFELSANTWDELAILDDDGYVESELSEAGGLSELKRSAPIRSVSTGAADLTRDVVDDPSVQQALDRERSSAYDRDRQSYVEVEASVGTAEAEAERAAELRGEQPKEGPDDDVAATIARHRQQASKRKRSEPEQVGGLFADFMKQHGRGMDGKPLPQQDSRNDDSMEL